MQEIVVYKMGNTDGETIDDDDYNEIVRLIAQEEENQEKNSFLSVMKLPQKMWRELGFAQGLANTVIG